MSSSSCSVSRVGHSRTNEIEMIATVRIRRPCNGRLQGGRNVAVLFNGDARTDQALNAK